LRQWAISYHQCQIDCLKKYFNKKEYDKQDQQGKAAFNERNPHMTQQQEPVARSQGDPEQKQDRANTFSLNFNVKKEKEDFLKKVQKAKIENVAGLAR
jgi:hypothetical protein